MYGITQKIILSVVFSTSTPKNLQQIKINQNYESNTEVWTNISSFKWGL